MSKIGRKPIPVASANVTIESDGNITVKGSKVEFSHELPSCLSIEKIDGGLLLSVKDSDRKSRMLWGLHRALLANKVKGVESGFERHIKIVGLGYKAQASGKKLVFSLGFSHKVDYELPDGVTVEIDKTGQNLKLQSHDKFKLGNACDAIRALRTPEPYKGTGIMYTDEKIRRKAGKTKAA